jgi:hypothetical protein
MLARSRTPAKKRAEPCPVEAGTAIKQTMEIALAMTGRVVRTMTDDLDQDYEDDDFESYLQ